MDVRRLYLTEIACNTRLQVRLQIDWAKVAQYALLVREGVAMDPIDVFDIDGKLLLVNGWHRFHAHQQSNEGQIDAKVHQGDLNAAMEFAAVSNAKNGLPLSKADRREAVRLILIAGGFERRSEREWVAELGISKTTLNRWKRELMIEEGFVVEEDEAKGPFPLKVPAALYNRNTGEFSAKGMPYYSYGQAVEQLLEHLEKGEVVSQDVRTGVLVGNDFRPDLVAARLRKLAAILTEDADAIIAAPSKR